MEFIGEQNPVFTGKSAQYIQHDAHGTYTIDPWGQKQYITSVDRQRQEGGSGLFSNKEFNPLTGDYENRINWGNILGLGTAGVIGGSALAGALPSAAAGGGTNAAVTSAAAAGTGPATVAPAIPTTMGIGSATSLGLPVTEGLGSAGAAGAAAAIPNGFPGSDGYVQGETYPNGIPNAAGGLAGLPAGWSTLLKALAGVGGAIGGNALANAGAQNAVPPQLSQLLDLSMQRANSQTPLFNAVNKGYYDMLPNFAKNGGQ